jgi:hypothetical protein
VFMYTFTEREKLYRLFEELTGARFTTSYTRIGGVTRDVPGGLARPRERVLRSVPPDSRRGPRAPDPQQDLHGSHRRAWASSPRKMPSRTA